MASVKPKCQYKYDEKIERKAEKSWKIKKSLKEIHVSSVTSILRIRVYFVSFMK
jgi:hypothetical protein